MPERYCTRCDKYHRTLSGAPVPICSFHIDPSAECDAPGSHLCGMIEPGPMDEIMSWMKRS